MSSPQAMRSAAAARQQPPAANAVASPPKADPLASLMEKLKARLSKSLPKHMTAERMTNVMLTELRVNEKLAEAVQSNPLSFMAAMMRAGQLGLEVGNGLGHCYLLPFVKRQKQGGQWVTVSIETQLIIGYRGMVDLARRSGKIENIYAIEVYAGEQFNVTLGLDPDIAHVRDMTVDTSAKNVIAVYAVAKLKGGAVQFEVMGRSQIEAIRARSKSKDEGPWVTDWAEMAKKTAIRRLFKYLPVSIEIRNENGEVTISSLDGADNFAESGDSNVFEVDKTTGEVLNTETRPAQIAENQPSVSTSESRPEQGRQQQSSSVLTGFNKINSIDALDEMMIRAEGDLGDSELEHVNRAYRVRKAELTEQGGSSLFGS